MREPDRSSKPVELVRSFCRASWTGTIDWDDAFLAAKDLSWVGSLESQYLLNREQTRAMYEGGISKTLPDVVISDEDFREIASEDGVHVVIGTFVVTSNPKEGHAYRVRQRTTAVLRETEDGYELVHQHASNPTALLRKGRELPLDLSKDSYWYIALLAAQYHDDESIEMRDVTGRSHVLRPFDIVRLEADRQRTFVHCIDGSFCVRMGIGAVGSSLPQNDFVLLRRGCVANIAHVRGWNADEVLLTGDVTVRLPSRRSEEVRRELRLKRATFIERASEAAASEGSAD
ncbi:MAG TPA: nuclear transport factor 2 family protein [Collinsella ihuae]|uniref:Nuclear transport factor 2 family protein n=1 Tax=Collinsella ihumii TaxID=1720204 RepID=A0A921IQQ6_9ACTN|nr:nuclear transport factor 2 family protein [Collinsella ihumii]